MVLDGGAEGLRQLSTYIFIGFLIEGVDVLFKFFFFQAIIKLIFVENPSQNTYNSVKENSVFPKFFAKTIFKGNCSKTPPAVVECTPCWATDMQCDLKPDKRICFWSSIKFRWTFNSLLSAISPLKKATRKKTSCLGAERIGFLATVFPLSLRISLSELDFCSLKGCCQLSFFSVIPLVPHVYISFHTTTRPKKKRNLIL